MTTAPLTEIAPAKINLALHVRRRRVDGYHDIESLFAFARDGDVLSAERADGLSLEVIGPFAEALAGEGDNHILRAARLLAAEAGVPAHAAIRLDKRLPVASGIGGGSADAAAALRLLGRLWGVNWPEARWVALSAQLGADVPACFIGKTLRGTGTGTDMEPIPQPKLSGAPLLLVNPGLPLSTAAVFRAWDGVDRGPLAEGDDRAALDHGRNDLEAPAIALVPEIGVLLSEMRALAPNARMSGSGATCFALCDTDTARDASAERLAARFPDSWILKTHVA